jgi:GNAT superfamily N-acetyltransferase
LVKNIVTASYRILPEVFIFRRVFAMNVQLNQNVLNEFQEVLIKKYKSIKELKLEYCSDKQGQYISLNVIRIKASQKNKGYGSIIMDAIVQLADEHNVRVRLYATNLWGAEVRRLQGFYKKHGFVLIKNDVDSMMMYYPKNKYKKL